MKDTTKVSLAAILGVIILEGIALARGIDGTLLSLSIGALCALAGVALPNPFGKRLTTSPAPNPTYREITSYAKLGGGR